MSIGTPRATLESLGLAESAAHLSAPTQKLLELAIATSPGQHLTTDEGEFAALEGMIRQDESRVLKNLGQLLSAHFTHLEPTENIPQLTKLSHTMAEILKSDTPTQEIHAIVLSHLGKKVDALIDSEHPGVKTFATFSAGAIQRITLSHVPQTLEGLIQDNMVIVTQLYEYVRRLEKKGKKEGGFDAAEIHFAQTALQKTGALRQSAEDARPNDKEWYPYMQKLHDRLQPISEATPKTPSAPEAK